MTGLKSKKQAHSKAQSHLTKYLSILDVSPRWTWPFFDGGFDRPEAEKKSTFKSTKSFDDVLINIKT